MSLGPLEDLYPLTPLQEGLLYHSLAAPGSTVYVEQVTWTLEHALDVPDFARAWQQAIDRHPILRTGFLWQEADDPLQVVYREVTLPLQHEDWREISPPEQRARLDTLIEAERQRGFDLTRAPLLRLAVVRLRNEAYACVWTFHHLLLDGWSVSLLLAEVFGRYRALREGTPLELPAPPPYRSFVAWLQQQDPAAAERFWRDALQDFGEATTLPVGTGVRAVDEPDAPAEHLAWIPEPTLRALQALARRERLTLNTIVQGAWALLLGHYCGTDDIMFGATVSIRPPDLPDVEGMLGLLINTLPVRAQLSADAMLVPWLKGLQARQVAARAFAHTPLASLQQWTGVPRAQPLFQTLVVFENYPLDQLSREVGSLGLEVTDASSATHPNYPLNVAVMPEQRTLRFVYSPRHFTAPAIERLAEHLGVLLEGIAANPERPLGELPLLSEAERRLVVEEWNRTARPYPSTRGIGELVAEQAVRSSDAIAVEGDGRTLTYAQLDARANQLAHRLRALGAGPGRVVGICAERSVELVAGLLGILKAGAAYLPLDPSYPAERLAFMLEDARADVLLVDGSTPLAGDGVQRLVLDPSWSTFGDEAATAPAPTAGGADPAYVMYTSGSTGTPKAVVVPHRAIARLVVNADYVALRSDDVVAQASNVSFDAATFEIWGALLAGARLTIVGRTVLLSTASLASAIEQRGITTLFLTTALFNELARGAPAALRGVRHLLFGGEAVDPRWVRRVLDEAPPERLLHVYGPTETTTFATWHLVDAVPDNATTVPIGRPIANTTTYVLDPHGQPVPIEVPGELYIGGPGVALGYLDRPEVTAERFVADPFSVDPDARLYRTGDLVRYRADGAIEFLGRLDQQVKIRGFRIEPGEIEATLTRHSAVRDAAVLVQGDDGDKRLIGYVVLEGTGASVEELKAHLRQHLPEYMVPATFVVLDALPLTANGKLDRRALPDPEAARPATEHVGAAPSTDLEETIAAIWRDVLQVERVGLDDNFFDLGGTSLQIMRVQSRLQEAVHREMNIVDLFEFSTVRALARHLTGDSPEQSAAATEVTETRGARQRAALGRARLGRRA
ncbi:MAG: amino acid adenylation domain-containing protein [Chloroflexi bacterium]|nr:amino acid adenylation domain-containing protein [Chloroflexota bacterium]